MAFTMALRMCVIAATLQVRFCDGARMLLQEVQEINCPPNAVINLKKYCVDEHSNTLDPSCCEKFEECQKATAKLMPMFESELEAYQVGCELEESDLAQDDDGWKVVDGTRACAKECVPNGIPTDVDGRVVALIGKCKGFPSGLAMQLDVMAMVKALGAYREEKCPADSATTATSTAIPSTTAPDPVDPSRECLRVVGAGEESFNGLWKLTSDRPRGRPQYQKVESYYVSRMEWSLTRGAWRIYYQNLLGFWRGSYYVNKGSSASPPETGWEPTSHYAWVGFNLFLDVGPAPTLEFVECP